ncbi:MAG TPA: cyclic nucleotide-binding domain-containing protein [Chroococcales cyanobacterium]
MPEANQELELEQLIKFLKEDSILKLISDSMLYGLSLNLEEIQCGPGHVVFQEGDASDGFYIIRKGAVEVRRDDSGSEPIAYLTQGECFGEMGLLSGGPRNATIRVPEEAVLLKLPEHSFNNLRDGFPALAEEFERLKEERTAGEVVFRAPGLQGNTAFFDLPTVIQAVAASHQSGWLNLFDTPGTASSRLAFRQGSLIAAFTEHLTGENALYQLLCIGDPLDFSFERCDERDLATEETNISDSRKLDAYLIEGARRVDEIVDLLESVGGAAMTFTLLEKKPDWKSFPAKYQKLARKLIPLIESEFPIAVMYPLVEGDHYSILDALKIMLEKKLIKQCEGDAEKVEAMASVMAQSDPKSTTMHARKAVTTELDLRQLIKGPAKVASTLYALNMVASNLATLVDISTVSWCLQDALDESSEKYPQLSSLKVHRGGKTIDVRGASPELSSGADSAQALSYLTKKFLQLIALKQSG